MPDVLRPLFDQVVIKELEPDRMRKSGLLVPQGTHDVPPNEGIVLAAGDGPPELADFKMPVKPGDHVVFPRSAGVWVEVEDERHAHPAARSAGADRARAAGLPLRRGRIVGAMPDVLRPLFDQVVIKELEPDRMRKSGLLVPQGTHDVPPNEGIVLAAGEGPPDLADFKMPVKPGDHVVFPRSAGVWVEVEDERLLVCRVREILGVIEEG